MIKNNKPKYILPYGYKSNNLTVIGKYILDNKHEYRYPCKCECGNIKYFTGYDLISGKIKSCGECNKYIIESNNITQFGRLTIIDKTYKIDKNQKIKYGYICKCECGNIVFKTPYELIKRGIKSCGKCIFIHIGDIINNIKIVEGPIHNIPGGIQFKCKCLKCGRISYRTQSEILLKTRVSCECSRGKYYISLTHPYKTYIKMIDRCYNKNAKDYNNYGGRGIKVCREWYNPDNKYDSECIKNFYNWSIMHPTYNPRYTIERINIDGNYCPENCIWIDNRAQQNNKHNNKFVDFNNNKISLGNVAYALGIDYQLLYQKSLRNKNTNIDNLLNINNINGLRYLKDSNGNNISINGIYFINEYGYIVNQNEYIEKIAHPLLWKINKNGIVTEPFI